MKYHVIGDEDTVLGFGMAGVNGDVVADADQALASFNEALADSDIGIILMTERTADMMRQTVDKFMFTKNFPLIVEIPDRNGRIPGRADIRETVNRAIGIKL